MKIKQKLIDAHVAEPFKIGERVQVRGLGLQDKQAWGQSAVIEKIVEEGIEITEHRSTKFVSDDDFRKVINDIGLNPFTESTRLNAPRNVNFTLDSILNIVFREDGQYKTDKGFPIKASNFNPFVELNGAKEYYQRELCWSLEDKQLLVESIYNGIACGSVVVRKRGFKWLEERDNAEECCFIDIVDSKQRLSAIREFMNDGFTDFEGRLFSDFSKVAQHRFTDHQLFAYFEFDEEATDQAVIQQFLKVNFTGKPQSKEHIEFVKSILKHEN